MVGFWGESMKVVLTCAAAAFALAAFVFPARAEPRPVFDWSGFYAGVDLGHFSSDAVFDLGGGANVFPGLGTDLRSFAGGVHAGYRWQPYSRVVLGLEADFWGINASDLSGWQGIINRSKMRARFGGSVRGIVGVTFDASMAYLTGGVSFIRAESCSTFVANLNCISDFTTRSTIPGWTLGAGIAHALSPRLIARIEYLYAFYDRDIRIGSTSAFFIELPTHTIRAGLSWRFATH